ncbi:MAG: hypothetical protein QXL94_08385 [Candidatus Parvarchaeum sp.]
MANLKTEGVIYFDNLEQEVIFPRNKRMSKAHIYIVSQCVRWLEHSKEFRRLNGSTVSVYAVRGLTADRVFPDVTTDFFDIEAETGLKHSYTSLINRIKRNPRMVIVVLPNIDVKERYIANCKIRTFNLKFCTLDEFPKTIHDVLRVVRERKKREKPSLTSP